MIIITELFILINHAIYLQNSTVHYHVTQKIPIIIFFGSFLVTYSFVLFFALYLMEVYFKMCRI